jgi:beta-glucosidase
LWYRVESAPDRFDWSFTDRVLPHLFERAIEPIVDLVHYGTPLWLGGSFLSPEYPERVARYAAEVARRYGQLRYFTTLNKPFVNAELCGRLALWPPYGVGDRRWTAVMHSVCKGIVRTVEELRRVQPDAVMVHVEAIGCGITEEPELRERLELDMARELAMLDLVSGRVGQTHPLKPYLTANGLQRADLEWFRHRAIDLDVVG